jgi:hypothetical protein
MESKLIDMISMGVLIYTLILLLDNIRNKNIVKKVLKIYKSNERESIIGIMVILLIVITNIYYKNTIVSEETRSKSIQLWNATLAGLIALVIAYFAYIEKIIPVFFFVFVIHYYLSIHA